MLSILVSISSLSVLLVQGSGESTPSRKSFLETLTGSRGQEYQCTTLSKERKGEDLFQWSSELREWTIATERVHEVPRKLCIWPGDCELTLGGEDEDRIVDQLKLSKSLQDKTFKILPPDYSFPVGAEVFNANGCEVNECSITYNIAEADALIFQNADVIKVPPTWRRMDQVWIAYLLESPPHTFDLRYERAHRGKHEFNWTATYRSDSDLVTPYSKFVPYENEWFRHRLLRQDRKWRANNRDAITLEFESHAPVQHKRLIANKSGKVAWFASNCNAANKRLQYARELAHYIQVDIFGICGKLTCDRRNTTTDCLELLGKNYKFYLAFENSNCDQYITEKLFKNALSYNNLNHLIVPIVMGAPRQDYEQAAPPASFIHVQDFASPRELADYLHSLDKDDALYYSYFHWKTIGRFIDTKFMCRVCAMLHETHRSGKVKWYSDLKSWWWRHQKDHNGTVCISDGRNSNN